MPDKQEVTALTEEDVKALQKLIPDLGNLSKQYPLLEEGLNDLKKDMEGFDLKAQAEKVDQIISDFETFKEAIRNSKNGTNLSGVEDTGKKFSMIRAFKGRATGKWEKYAPYEYEVMSQNFKSLEAEHKNTINTLIESESGFFIPDQVIPEVIAAIYQRSAFVRLQGADVQGETRVRLLDGLLGSPVRIPKFNGGMVAYWLGENEEMIESKISTGHVNLSPNKLTILAVLTEEMMRFASPGLETMFRRDLSNTTAEELDRAILYGSGQDGQPRGLFKNPRVQYFDASTNTISTPTGPDAADNTGGELDFDGLQEMQGVVEDADREIRPDWSYIAPPRYWRRLKQLKVDSYAGQAENRAYLLGLPMVSDQRLRELIGDFDKSTKLPTANVPGASADWATNITDEIFGDVVAANWQEVVLGRWFGFEILDDGGVSDFKFDRTMVKGRLWADINVRQDADVVLCPNAQIRDTP